MGGKRQEGAEDEDRKRMLAAKDERPQHIRGERRPVAWDVSDRQGSQGNLVIRLDHQAHQVCQDLQVLQALMVPQAHLEAWHFQDPRD